MQRMYEEKRLQMERRSIGGSYFMVQLPDGSMEKRMKMPINIDPGVHSSLNLDQLAAQQAGLHPVATLPTITESKVQDSNAQEKADAEAEADENGDAMNQADGRRPAPRRVHRNSESDAPIEFGTKNMPRNASQPAFTSHHQGLPKNGSVPTFDRVRKTSTSERFKPSLAAIKASSRGDMGNGEVRKSNNLRLSVGSFVAGSKSQLSTSDGVSEIFSISSFYFRFLFSFEFVRQFRNKHTFSFQSRIGYFYENWEISCRFNSGKCRLFFSIRLSIYPKKEGNY